MRLRLREDLGADRLDARRQRRDIEGEAHGGCRFGHCFEHPVGQPIDKADEEMPGTHGRVANLQIKQQAGRI